MRNIMSKTNGSKFALNRRSDTTEWRIDIRGRYLEWSTKEQNIGNTEKNEGHKGDIEKSNMYIVKVTEAGETGQKKYLKR